MAPKKTDCTVTIPALKEAILEIVIVGTAPYVQHKFSEKAKLTIKNKQEAGMRAAINRKREPKDFLQEYENAKHVSTEGWLGIPATAIRNAMISACRLVGFAMTRAKLGFFIEPDGFEEDGTPLIRIIRGEPEYYETTVRLDAAGTPDIRVRPMWKPGWAAKVRIRYDTNMFTADDIVNLLYRAGAQVGIGEGRPDSKKSGGLGFGLFKPEGTGELIT